MTRREANRILSQWREDSFRFPAFVIARALTTTGDRGARPPTITKTDLQHGISKQSNASREPWA